MKRPQDSQASLWHALRAAGDLSGRFVFGAEGSVAMSDLVAGTILFGRGEELYGRSVLVMTAAQFTTASTVIELDGIARRIVLCPPDLPLEHLPYVIDTAEVDAIVSDRSIFALGNPRQVIFCPCSRKLAPRNYDRTLLNRTEWVLLTSGTMGRPKLVLHTLTSLTGAIENKKTSAEQESIVWSTFYDIRRYGGLQILLRAALRGKSLVLTSAGESTADFLARAAFRGVTHISGTPSQWRRAFMTPAARLIAPKYVRLSGEIADQGILNRLRFAYPEAKIVHAFASTEAGVAFEVGDDAEGFPPEVLQNTTGVEMKIENGSLHVRSARIASCYLGLDAPVLKETDGFVDTGDMVDLRDGRFYFAGRRDGMINVGGLKVYPEEVEAVINRHPKVQGSLVRAKKNALTGAVVVADVVLKSGTDQNAERNTADLQNNIMLFCREALSFYKVPAAINFVSILAVAESGKMVRSNA